MSDALAVIDPSADEQAPLARLEQARQLLAEARDVDDVLKVRDYAAAARIYAQQAKLGLDAQNYAAEIKLRAERRAGELFALIPRERGFAHTVGNVSAFPPPMSHSDRTERNGATAVLPTPYEAALAAAEVAPSTARRWQQIALVPEPVFEQHLEETKARGRELTTAGLAQLAREQRPSTPASRPAQVRLAGPTQHRIIVADVRAGLRSLPSKSVHVVVTSPPYYSLRSYGGEPTVWGGACCEHEHAWGQPQRAPWANDIAGPSPNHPKNSDASHYRPKEAGQNCTHVHEWHDSGFAGWNPGGRGGRSIETSTLPNRSAAERQGSKRPQLGSGFGQFCECDAWRGHFGLEILPDCLAWARGEPPCSRCYVCHTRTVLAELRRVLRDDGLVWWNIGESYAGSGKGPTGWSGVGDQERRQGFPYGEGQKRTEGRENGYVPTQVSQRTPPGVRRKSQIGIPERVKLAAMADGWICRSTIPWIKPAAMPESVDDRPANAAEVVLLLAKSERVFYDAEAVRMPGADRANASAASQTFQRADSKRAEVHPGQRFGTHRPDRDDDAVAAGRNRRNSDWMMESLQGLLGDEDGDPLVLVVNPQPFPGAHFAVFSPKLIEPMIRCSTSEHGVCPECGAPWARELVPTGADNEHNRRKDEPRDYLPWKGGNASGVTTLNGQSYQPRWAPTGDWKPTCKHYTRRDDESWDGPEPVPATTLDLFYGAGSTGLAAARLGRNSIGIELSPKYAQMAADRITAEAPMLVQVELVSV